MAFNNGNGGGPPPPPGGNQGNVPRSNSPAPPVSTAIAFMQTDGATELARTDPDRLYHFNKQNQDYDLRQAGIFHINGLRRSLLETLGELVPPSPSPDFAAPVPAAPSLSQIFLQSPAAQSLAQQDPQMYRELVRDFLLADQSAQEHYTSNNAIAAIREIAQNQATADAERRRAWLGISESAADVPPAQEEIDEVPPPPPTNG